MGIFDKFKNADVMGVRQYIEEGNHRLLVKRVSQFMSKNPLTKNQENVTIEFKVIRTTPKEPDQKPQLKVGMTCNLVETSKSQGYEGNVLAAVAGILGLSIDEMKADDDFDDVFGSVFNEDQLLTGILVDCTAQKVKTKAGGDYTAKTWEPVRASEYAQHGLEAPAGAYLADAIVDGDSAAA